MPRRDENKIYYWVALALIGLRVTGPDRTMENRKYLTLQETFDKAALHMIKQGEPAWNNTNDQQCMYLAPSGLKCGVGGLIDEPHYSPECEDYLDVADVFYWPENALYIALDRSGVNLDNPGVRELLPEIQSIHDDNPAKTWRLDLMDLGDSLGLSIALLEKLP